MGKAERSLIAKMSDIRKRLKELGMDGEWDKSPYYHGIHNGMEFALSVLEERTPRYKRKKNKYLTEEIQEIKEGKIEQH